MLRKLQQRVGSVSSLISLGCLKSSLCGKIHCINVAHFSAQRKVDIKIKQIKGRSGNVVETKGKTAPKIQHQTHSRTHWYMCGVEGITEGPTALGNVPEEYLPSRKYINDKTEAPKGAHVHIVGGYDADVHAGPYYYLVPAKKRETCPFEGLKVLQSEIEGFTRPKLAVSAFTVGQTPPVRSHTRDVEVVFCGRSNVGKSSLLNAQTSSSIAHAAQTPGKTQSLNFYATSDALLAHHKAACTGLAYAASVNPYETQDFLQNLKWGLDQTMEPRQQQQYGELVRERGSGPLCYLVDVPGYGFAKAPQPVVDHWNAQIGGYIRQRAPARYPVDENSSAMYLEAMENQKRLTSSRTAATSDKDTLAQVEDQVMDQLYKAIRAAGQDVASVDASHLENQGVSDTDRVLELQHQKHALATQAKTSTNITNTVPPYIQSPALHGSPLKLVVILVDPVLGLDKHDLNFLDFLEQFQIPHQIVLTKADHVTERKLEGAALSVAQTLFPHVYSAMYAQKRVQEGVTTLPLLAADKALKKQLVDAQDTPKPLYNMTANEEAVWVRASQTQPRKHCSPLLLAISSQKKTGIQTLKKAILNAVYTHV